MAAEQFEAETESRKQDTLVTIATYWQPGEASLAKSRLEADGVRAFLADQELIAMDWLLANSVGGIKLQVASQDANRARRILRKGVNRRRRMERRVIAQVVREGNRAELPMSPPSESARPERKPHHSPQRLIKFAVRSCVLGFFFLIVPLHVYSYYLLRQAKRLPGEWDESMRRKYLITSIVDLIVITVWWLPLGCLLLYLFIDTLIRLIL